MKVIKEFPNYRIDKDGTVTTKDGKVLTHSRDNMGYLTVSLRKDGKSYTKRVHRLVGEAYLKPVKGKNIINHIDGNKNNPHIDNLEYMSNSENTKHGYDSGLYKSTSMLPVIATRVDGSDEREFRSIRSLSNELGLNRKTVSSILNESRKNNYDYIFKYKDIEKAVIDKNNKKEVDEMDKKAEHYKEAIYKEASNKDVKKDNDTAKYLKGGLAALGLNTASMGGITASDKYMPKLSDSELVEIAKQKARDIGYKDDNTIKVKKIEKTRHSSSSGHPYIRPDIETSNNEFTARHELGHIKDNYKRHKKQHNKRYSGYKYDDIINDKVELDNLINRKNRLTQELAFAEVDMINATKDDYKDKVKKFVDKENEVKLLDDSITNLKIKREKFMNLNDKIDRVNTRNKKIISTGAKMGVSSLHSKTVRDAIREKNNGKSKLVEKSMDALDNPYISSSILGIINNSPKLKKEIAASTDATKEMIKKYGLKKGLALSAPIFAAQTGSYVTQGIFAEALKGSVIRGGETFAEKAATKNKKEIDKMDKKAEYYKEAIYKEASNAVGSVDWSKQKHIPSSNYKIRDANLKEKAMYGLEQGAKAAKKGAKLLKNNPSARVATGIMVGAPTLAYAANKVSNKNRDKDTKTKMIRDRLLPDAIEDIKGVPVRTAIMAAGMGAGLKGGHLGAKLATKAVLKGAAKTPEDVIRIARGAINAGTVLGAGSTVLAGAALDGKIKQRNAVKRLDKLSQKHLGRPATESEKNKIKNSYKAFGYKPSMITPESEIQNRRRAKEKRMKKKASVYLDLMVKEASTKNPKWDKNDKKGYLRNVAIGVAQDFMNAGNPLNIGSSVVGSIADAAILERSSLNLNKKLKAEQVSKEKVDEFNKAVGLKNGTTALTTAKKLKRK